MNSFIDWLLLYVVIVLAFNTSDVLKLVLLSWYTNRARQAQVAKLADFMKNMPDHPLERDESEDALD